MTQRPARKNNSSEIPIELQGVASTSEVNELEKKVANCYSKDRYEEFMEAVEKITLKYLKGKVGWVIAIWLLSIIGSILAQKFFKIF